MQTTVDKAAEELTDTAMKHFFAMSAKERTKSRKAARKVMARVKRAVSATPPMRVHAHPSPLATHGQEDRL